MIKGKRRRSLKKFYRRQIYLKWLIVAGCWSILLPIIIWGLRTEIELLKDYFTWTALRYSLAFNLPYTLLLVICLWLALRTLFWQIKNALFGLSPQDKYYLKKRFKEKRFKSKKK